MFPAAYTKEVVPCVEGRKLGSEWSDKCTPKDWYASAPAAWFRQVDCGGQEMPRL